MDIFELITTIHDLSQKSDEYNEEIESLNLTVKALGTALWNIE